ncbi:phospholipase D-like domain-containing protein [Persephonella sp.]
MSKDKILILSSGDILVEEGVISIESKLLEMLENTENDLYILMYTVSSKPNNFWMKLEELLQKKIKIFFVLESSLEHNDKVMEILDKLKRYDNFHLYFYYGDYPLHAKLIVSDGKRAILGSANISGGGLNQNHEIAVYIEGGKAWILKKLAKRLIRMLSNENNSSNL